MHMLSSGYASSSSSSMSISGIQGQLLEVTVVGCNKLRDTEWISRQDPYVCLEYGSNRKTTRTHTDGGKNPTFQEKFTFTLIEGLRELNIAVYNSNTVTNDAFIGSGKVQLAKALSKGYDDSSWSIQTKHGRHAGEVKLIMHYENINKPAKSFAPSAPPYGAQIPQVSLYSAPPASAPSYPPPATTYPTPSPYPSYPPTSAYAPSPYPAAYPPPTSAYPPSPYPAAYPPPPSAYPPPPPPSAYPPSPYPPPPQASNYYPPGSYPGLYPSQPY